jgi:spermidine synthase
VVAVATTGFAGMALEIILIFAFQNIYGYVYEKIGLIIALFMFGLAAGSSLSNRMILQKTSSKDLLKILIFLEVAIILYACTIPIFFSQLSFQFVGSEYLFMLLVIIAGILTGFEFPIASKLYFLCKRDSGVTAGMIDSADHAGAFMGAMLTGVLFVPIFGVVKSCIIIAVLNLMSLLFLMHLFSQKQKIGNLS